MSAAQSVADRTGALREPPAVPRNGASGARICEDTAVLDAWMRLEAAATLPTQGHAFFAALGHTLLAQAHMEVFRSAATGPDALLPLCRGKGYFSRWRLVGAREVFEPGDVLYEKTEGVQALVHGLARQPRPLDLDRVPAGSPLLPAMRKAMKGRGWLSIRPAVAYPTIALDDRWKSPETCFNSGRRSDFRRAARKAEALGVVGYDVVSPGPAEFDALFDEAIGVEVRSWKKEAGTALAVDRGKEDFFRDYFRACSQQGLFRMAFLRIDGRAVAMQMGVEFADRYWLFKIGYDENFGKCSPGTLLMLHTLGWAARQELKAYELLGNVEAWIADFWTRDLHECVRLRTYPFGVRGLVAFLADASVWLKQRLVRALA